MAYEVVYRMQANDFEGQDWIIHISDTTSPVGTPVFTDLLVRDIVISSENSGDDKHSIFRPKKIDLTFQVSETVGLQTFIQGEDNQFLVEAYVGSTANKVFIGYLLPDDTSESFVEYRGNGSEYGVYEVKLLASDGLGILKDIDLTMPDGTNPRGYYKPIEYIAWILQKTNLQLPINSADGICEVRALDPLNTDGNWLNHTYLWSKTFEQEINKSVSCYEALEMMLKGRFITQENGEWWIVRPDEMDGTAYLTFEYDYEGNYTGFTATPKNKLIEPVSRTQDIIDGKITIIDNGGEVTPERKHKYTELTFNFETPIEIIDNFDFGREGTLLPVVPNTYHFVKSYANTGAFPATGQFEWIYVANDTSNQYKWNGVGYTQLTPGELFSIAGYTIPDWTQVTIGGGTPGTTYIAVVTQAGIERARYAVIIPATNMVGLQSNGVYMHRDDNFTFSLDMRTVADIGGTGYITRFAAQVRLYGDDGTYWFLTNQFQSSPDEVPGQWVQTNSTFATNQRYIAIESRASEDEREWMSASVEARPMPVGGVLQYILLGAAASTEVHFSNIQLEYIPFLKGTYAKYDGQFHKVSQPGNIKANLEDEVRVSDSPKRLFKGCLMVQVGSLYLQTESFYNHNATVAGELQIAPFGKYQAFEYWNQHKHESRLVQDTMKGINSMNNPADLPGLIHTYSFGYTDHHTTNKLYSLLSYKMKCLDCEWSGVFGEVYDSTKPREFTDDHEFDLKRNT